MGDPGPRVRAQRQHCVREAVRGDHGDAASDASAGPAAGQQASLHVRGRGRHRQDDDHGGQAAVDGRGAVQLHADQPELLHGLDAAAERDGVGAREEDGPDVGPGGLEEDGLLHRRHQHAAGRQVRHPAAHRAAPPARRLRWLVLARQADVARHPEHADRVVPQPDGGLVLHRSALAALVLYVRGADAQPGVAAPDLRQHPQRASQPL
mmetsp:Transcript_28935/g.68604  ORF Transcript_28935/g.68604 Transcript_28935/m.68604 type:complete len:208 (+) Transcript_28935:678-1301(+)